MPAIFYTLRNLPPGLCNTAQPEPFRHAAPQWRKLGLGPIVERVAGNGVLHQLDDGRQRLCVWPADQEYSPPTEPQHDTEIDQDLTISWSGDDPPGPDDLDNGNPLRLQTVPMILADGNAWQIPEIREPGGSLLPRDLVRDRLTGRLKNPLKREYEALWEETEYWFDLFWKHISGEASTFDMERGVAFVTQVISLRYRFCDATQAALRIIDSTNLQAIIGTAIGWPAVLERLRVLDEDDTAQKKSPAPSAGTASGNSGVEASGPIIDPLAENSGSQP